MSCDTIKSGRPYNCTPAIAGLLNVYFMNFDDATDVSFNATTEEVVSSTKNQSVSVYKYALHLGNDLTQNIMANDANGTLYFEQLTNLTLKGLSSEDNVAIREIASSRPLVFVEDQMGQVWLTGRVNGNSVVSGTAVTGNDYGDLQGYTLGLSARERTLANFYTGGSTVFLADYAVVTGE